jgi:hypothetical protein
MKYGVILVVVCILFLGFAPVSHALSYDESADGDFSDDSNNPSSIGPLALGSNIITGSMDHETNTDLRDLFTFEIASGYQLEQVLWTNFERTFDYGTHYTSFDLKNAITDEEIEGALVTEYSAVLDLLQFDSAPGPQGAGLYTIHVGGVGAGTYSLNLVVTVVGGSVVPEPGSMALFAIGIVTLLGLRFRRKA